MKRPTRGVAPVTDEEQQRFERIVADGTYAGMPLFPEFCRLYELFGHARERSAAATGELERLKTQLVEMNRSLDLATRIDPLTGLANRRDIVEKTEQEHSRAERHKRTYSLIFVDIDDFRLINDAYGINVGDDVLVEIACVLRECVRNEDICSRWGGEEFLFLLPETGLEGALAVAGKILQAVAMTEFKVNKPGIRTTVSLGVCSYREGQTVAESLKRVEAALASAKQGGKNRYAVAQ